MTNEQFPMTNGGGRKKTRRLEYSRRFHPQLVICHWDLVIPAIIRQWVRE
jgi:hypothetical protein